MEVGLGAPTVRVATRSTRGDRGIRHACATCTETSTRRNENLMHSNLFTRRGRETRSHRPGFFSSMGRELRDLLYDGDRIDWVSLLMVSSMGSLFGVLLSLTLETDGEYLVRAETLLWAGFALLFMLGGALLWALVATTGMAIVIGVDLLHHAGRPRRERRLRIRENTRQLRDAIVNDRIPLADLETVRTSLRVRDDSAKRNGSGWYERLLLNRWRRQRARVEGLLEISWREALPEALELLKAETRRRRWGRPTDADLEDTTEVAWYLARNPAHPAVQRLLSEYLTAERKNGDGYLEFRTGVVYTPRWVYELVRLVEQSARASRDYFGGYRVAVQNTVSDDYAPIGDVDRETVEKLYEPHGDGPLGSLREVVETARSV